MEFFIPDDEARQVLKLKLFDIVNSRRKNCSIIDSDLNKGDLYEEMEIIVDRNKEEFEILREISEYEEDKFYQFSQAVMNFQNIKDQVRIISGNSMILYSSKSRIPINQIIEENLEPRQERHSSPKMVDTKISTCDIQDTSTQSIQESEISTYMRQNHAVQIKQLNPKVNIPVKISSEDEIAKEHNPLNKKKFLHGNSKINYCWHCYQIFENSKYARDFCSEDCQNDHIEKTKVRNS